METGLQTSRPRRKPLKVMSLIEINQRAWTIIMNRSQFERGTRSTNLRDVRKPGRTIEAGTVQVAARAAEKGGLP